jgi:hypothetical protein
MARNIAFRAITLAAETDIHYIFFKVSRAKFMNAEIDTQNPPTPQESSALQAIPKKRNFGHNTATTKALRAHNPPNFTP